MLSRRNAAAFLVMTVAFVATFFILSYGERAEAETPTANAMCATWFAECGCGMKPNPDKTSAEKCIKGANTNKCGEGICFDDTDDRNIVGICTAKNVCKATKVNGKPPKTCRETGECPAGPNAGETPQTPTPQTPQTPQTPSPQTPQTPETPPNPEREPEPTIPAGCDLVSGAGCTPQPAEPTPRTDGAATNPWLTGERQPDPSTANDPNALTPATTPDPATRSIAPTNPFGEQIQTAQEAQRGGFWSNLYDTVFGPPASITPSPSTDTQSDPMTGSLYNNVVQPDLGTMTGFDPPPSATAGTTPTESTPTDTSWRDTLSNAWDTVRDTANNAYETLATTATDAYNGARDMLGLSDSPPSEPLALEPSQDVTPTPTTASYGADELTTAEREAYEAAQAAAQPRDPEIVAAENAILQDRLAQADREEAEAAERVRAFENAPPAVTPAEVTPESIQRQVEADIASRIPTTEPAVTDPQREVEKQIARDILAGDRTLPPVRTDGPTAQELTRQIQESKEQRIDPVVARVEESNERLRQMNSEFERLDRERQRFVDQNAAGVDRDGRPTFTRQADVDAYNRIIGEQNQLQSNFRGEDVTNQALRSELTDRVGQHNELVQQLQAMPAENRLISALQTERTSLGDQITAATERRDALSRELAATPQSSVGGTMDGYVMPTDQDIQNEARRAQLDGEIRAENERITQLQQQARFNETLQSCLSNCTNRADVAAALTAKPETPAQEVARNGLLNQVAQWGDQQNTLARANAIQTLYGDRSLDTQTMRAEIANRTEQIGKIDNTIADYGRIMRGEEPLNYAVQRQVDTVLSDRAPWTAERVMTEGVVGRYVTDTLTGWARSMSDAGIPALVNPVAWVAGISDSALALGDNPTASRQFSELSMLTQDYYATRVLDVINVATVVDPMLGNPGMRALSEGIQFARAAEFYGATFAGREMPFGAGFATRETVAPNFGSVATDLEFTQIRPGVWAYADDIASAERTAAITETRLLTGPGEVPVTGPISEVRMLPAPVDGAPTGVFANADTRIVVADLATPWEQLPTWAQNAFLERGYIPPSTSIVERAGLTEVAALDRPFIETPITRAPEIVAPVALRDVVPESAPRLAESPRIPETLVAERPVLEFTLAPEAPPTQPLVRVADTVPPVTAVETPRVASPAITPASEIPATAPTFTERVRDFFGFGPPPPVAAITPLEAVAISNFNNALSDYSRIENRTDVSPFTRSAILKDVSDSYRALSTAGLYQSARDGSITRENGDVLAARLPVHVPGNAPYYTTAPVQPAASAPVTSPTVVTPAVNPAVTPETPLAEINPAIIPNPNIASGLPDRGTLPGEIAPARDIFRKIMTGPATAGLLSFAALSNPAFTTAADAASPNFNTCIASQCLKPVSGPTSFYDPRKGGINIDPRYVVGNSALTKSGEPVSMAANSDVYQHMTMASERYPVNTIVYTCNGPTCVYVRVNDTGSFERYGRVGDLMPGPVRALGFDVNRGVVPISQRPIVMFAGPNGQHRLPVNQIADGVMRDLNRGVPLATALDNAAKTAPMPFTYTLPNMTTAYNVLPGTTPGTALAGVQAPPPTIAGNAPQQPAPAVQPPAAPAQPAVVTPPPPPPTASEVTQQLEQRILQQIQQRGLDTADPVSRRIQQQLDQTNDFARRANRAPVFPQSVPAPVQSPLPANQATAPTQSPVTVATRSLQQPPAVAVQPYAQLGGEVLAQTEAKIQQEWIQQMRQRGFQVVEAVNPNGVYYRQTQPYEKPVSPMVFPVSHVTYTSTGAQTDAQRSSQIDVRPIFGRAAFGAHMFIDNCASGKCTIYLSAPFNQRVNHVAGAAQYRINGAPEAYNWNSLAIEISAPNEAAVTPAAAGTLAEAVRAFGEVSGQPQFSQNIVSHQKVNPKSPGEGEKGVAAVRATPQNLAYRPQWMATQPRVAVAPAPAPLSLDVIQPGFAGRPATAAQAEAVLRDIAAIIPADRNFNIGNPTELAALNRALTARGYPPIMPPRSVKPFGVQMQTVGMIQGKTLQVFAGTQAILGQSFPITAATESGHSTRHGGPHAVGSAIDFEAAPFDIGNHVFSVPRAQRAVTPLPYDSTSVQFQKYRAVLGATTGYVAGRMCSFGGATTCAVTMGVYPGFGTHLDTIAGIANTYNQGLRVTSPELQSVIARYQNQSQTRITFDEVSVLAQNAGFVDRAPYTIANRGNPNLTAGTPARNIAQAPSAVTPSANQPMPPAALPPSLEPLPTLVLPRMVPDVAANLPRGRVEPQTALEPAPTPARTWTPLIPQQPMSPPPQLARTETVRLANAPIRNGDVLIATTPGYTPLKPTNVVVYFHGHSSRYVNAGIEDSLRRQQILEQLKGTNSILIIPELGPLSNAGQLASDGGFYRMLNEAGQHIQRSYGVPTANAFNAAPVTVVAYSGGHAPALAVANNGYVSRFQRVVLMEAGYGSNFASGWADWLTRNPNATLVSGYLRGTSGRNLELVTELQQRGIALSTQAPAGQSARAFVYNAPATIAHHEFMQRAWVPTAVAPNVSVAQAPQRLSTIPAQQPAPVTQPLVRAETVPVISRTTPPPSNTAQLAQPHMTPVGNQPFAIGDSIANLLVRQGGLRGAALDGLSPQRVLDVIRNLPVETLRGRTVYLSSGASNTGGDIAQVQRIVPQQVAALRAAGANVVLLGVGPRMPAAMNDALRQIAAQNQGTRFSTLPTTHDGIHPRTARELLASINAQAPAPTVAVNPPSVTPPTVTPPTVTPPIVIRPVVTIPVVNPPAVTPPVVTPPTVTPPAVTPPVVILPVVTRPVVNPPAVTPPATPRIATVPVPVPLPKPRIAPSRTEPTPAPVVQAPAPTPATPVVAPTAEMNTIQSQIARIEGERRALTDRLQQLKEFPNTRQLNDLARRGLDSLRKDSQPTPGDIAAMGAGQNAVAQLERAARLAGDIATANQLAQMRGTLSTLSGLGKQLADVVQRQYNGSYTAAYFAGNPLLARVMALRTNALSTGDALVRAMEGKNFTAAVQTQTTQITTRISQIDQQLAGQRAELTRLAQAAQTPVVPNQPQPAPVPAPVQVTVAPPLQLPPLALDLTPPTPASNMPAQVPAPRTPTNPGQFPLGPLVPVYRTPRIVTELPRGQALARGTVPPSPEPLPQLSAQIEQLLAVFAERMKNRPALSTGENIPVVGSIDPSPAPVFASEPTATEMQLATAARDARDHGPLAQANPGDLLPRVALPNTDAPLILSPRAAAAIDAPMPARTSPQIVLDTVTVNGREMLTRESGIRLAETLYESSPELQALRVVQARAAGKEIFSVEQMRGLADAVGQSLAARTGVRFELIQAVELSPGIYGPPATLPSDTTLTRLYYKNGVPTADNGGSWSQSANTVYFYEELAQVPGTFINELIHETGAVLLGREFGGKENIPKVLVDPVDQFAMYATHLLDHEVGTRTPGQIQSPTSIVIEQRALGPVASAVPTTPDIPFTPAAPVSPTAPVATAPVTPGTPTTPAAPTAPPATPKVETSTLALNVLKGSLWPADTWKRNAALYPFSIGMAMTGGTILATPIVNVAWKSLFNPAYRNDVKLLSSRAWDGLKSVASRAPIIPAISKAFTPSTSTPKPTTPTPTTPTPGVPAAPTGGSGGNVPPTDARPWKSFADGWNPSSLFSPETNRKIMRYGPLAGVFGLLALLPSDTPQSTVPPTAPPTPASESPADCTQELLDYQNAMRALLSIAPTTRCNEPLPDAPSTTPAPTPPPTVGSYVPGPGVASYSPTNPGGNPDGTQGTPSPMQRLASLLSGMMPSLARLLGGQNQTPTPTTPTPLPDTTGRTATTTPMPIMAEIIARPNPVQSGASTTVSWYSVSATLCRVFSASSSQQIATGTPNGSFPINPALATSTFRVTCQNDAGQTATSATTIYIR